MKKFIGMLTVIAVFMVGMSACQPEVKKEVVKEVIVVPAKPSPIIVEKAPEKKGTTIVLDKNGVKVEAKKVDVTIKNP